MTGKRRGRFEGSIEGLPSGKFRAVHSGGTDPQTGKRRKQTKSFDSKKEAVEWLRRVQEDVHGEWARRELSCWLDHWLALKKPNLEPASHVWYDRRVRLHLKPRIGRVPLANLKPMHVRELLAEMTKDGKSAGEQHKALKTLRAALEDAVRLEQIGRNVARLVKLPKVTQRDMVCLNRDQAKAFLRAAASDRLTAMYTLELDAGMRPGELFALHWPDVDFEAGAIFVRWSLEEISGKCRLKAPKTLASRRRILLAPRTIAALAAHRTAMLAEGKGVKEGLVFCGPEGGFLRISDVRRLSFLPILKRAALPAVRLYDLRHTVATLLLAADVNVKVVSERLGHESINITLKHYAHALPSMQQRAAVAIESIFSDCPTSVPQAG